MRIKGNSEQRTANTERRTTSGRAVRCSLFPASTFFVLSLLVISLGLFAAFAQPTTEARVKGFRVPQYCDPPRETQMKSLLEGAEAEPLPGGLIAITNLKLQTFNEVTGEPQMLVSAPKCVFDSSRQTLNSDGPLQVRTADRNLLVEGEGFFWQQTNSNLIISNRVRTTVNGPLDISLMP